MSKRKTLWTFFWRSSLFLFGTLILLHLASMYRLKQSEKRLESIGRPTTIEGVIAKPVPPEENAVLFKDKYFQLYEDYPLREEMEDRVYNIMSNQGTQADYDSFDRDLEQIKVQEILGLVEQANQKSRSYRDYDYSLGINILLPHLYKQRYISRFLSVLSIKKARDGHLEEAWDILLLGLKEPFNQNEDNFLISQMVRNAQLISVLSCISKLATIAPPSEAQNNQLVSLMEAYLAELPGRQERSMDTERIVYANISWYNLSMKEKLYFINHENFFPQTPRHYIECPPTVSNLSMAYLNRIFYDLAPIINKPYTEDVKNEFIRIENEIPYFYPAALEVSGYLEYPSKRTTECIARFRMNLILLRILKYYHRHQKYPSEQDLYENILKDSPELTIDPFLENKKIRFVYKRQENGFLIYSVGENHIDDSGHDILPRPQDLVLKFPNPIKLKEPEETEDDEVIE